MAWKDLLGALLRRDELSAADTAWGMSEIMQGNASAAQIAGFALLLRAKGETAAELAGLVDAMLSKYNEESIELSVTDRARKSLVV